MELRGLRGLVTGAGVGIGRAIAERLAAEGVVVLVNDVDAAGAAETVRRIRAAGGRAEPRAGDLLDAAQRESVAAGHVDLLVNVAGGGGHIPPHFPVAAPAVWGATLDLNLRVPLLLIQLTGARAVVMIGSSAGSGTGAYAGVEYAAAKAGLVRATTSMRGLAPAVRVNCVVPDWVATDRALAELADRGAAQRAAEPALVPLDVVADEVVGLLREDAAAGRVVVLDRGRPPRLLT